MSETDPSVKRTGAAAEPAPGTAERSYPIPFERVWRAVLDRATKARGWTITASDPVAGVIRAETRTRVWKLVDRLEIRVRLDDRGSTRVEVRTEPVTRRPHLGVRTRAVRRFVTRLDRTLSEASR